jgi:hypothetical protein
LYFASLSNLSKVYDLLQLQFLALPGIIRQGWKSLPGTNTLAYYEHL